MLRLFIVVGMLFISPISYAAAKTQYISDDVYTYLLSGPGTQFRILGSISAGQKVTSLSETQGGYSKISDARGRKGWVESKMLKSQKSLRVRLPEVQKELASTKARLADIMKSNDSQSVSLSQLKSQLRKTEAALESATSERDIATKKLASLQKDERYEMWRQGGFIGAIGLFFGMILVYLPRPQRKPKNRW